MGDSIWVRGLPFFTAFGIRVRVHIALLIFLALWALQWTGAGASVGMFALFVAFVWTSILLHEYGHCFAARGLGLRADEVVLWPFGGLAFTEPGRTAKEDAWISFAGPLVNLVLAGGALAWHAAEGGALGLSLVNPYAPWGDSAAADLLRTNVLLAGINLLIPAYPLDGGRILTALLTDRIGRRRAIAVSTRIAVAIAGAVAIVGLVIVDLWLVAAAALVVMQAMATRRQAEAGQLPGYAGPVDWSGGEGWLRPDDRDDVPERERPGFFERRREAAATREREQSKAEESNLKKRVDRLLEKISKDGIDSLSGEEREFLKAASKRLG